MDLIKTQTLMRSDGSEVEAKSALFEKELVLIYFSAKWCPQSERYTPMLKEFYEKVANEGVEIVFASWDKSSEEMLSNMKESHGDWLALKHDFDGSTDPVCTFNFTKERYPVQKMYKCATCEMADPGCCICEVCIKTCHDGHDISLYGDRGNKDGIGRGFCDCGSEGSEGKRICKNLKEKSKGVREELEEKFNVEDLPTLVVMKADGTLVTENGVRDIIDEEASEVVKEWKEHGTDASKFCEIIKGSSLIKADESSKPIDEVLAGKDMIMIYFSAHWCPPCKRFTPILKKFYDETVDTGIELIFVSSDRSSEDMLNYMKESHGDWYAFEHGSKIGKKLKKKFSVEGIPSLVVMKSDGTVITDDGVQDVMGEEPSEIVKEWKEFGTDADNFCEIVKGINVVKADESTKPIDEILSEKDIVLVYFSAHWCPPCRMFTPLLKKFYEEHTEKGIEVIFVSWDESSEEMFSYMKESHGDWYALEHESKVGKKLRKKFKVDGIPTLVALKADGTLIDRNARNCVDKGEAIISEWKSM